MLMSVDRQYNVKDILVIISYDLTNLIQLYLSTFIMMQVETT